MKTNPLRVLPSIRFTSVEISEQPVRAGYGELFEGLANFTALVPSRDAPEHEIEIRFAVGLPRHWALMPEDSRASWLRSQLMNFVGHEIDEMLFLAGLGRDPHAPRQPPPLEFKMKTFSLADVTFKPDLDLTSFVDVPELEP